MTTREDRDLSPEGKQAESIAEWIRRLEAAHPDAGLALDFSTPLELLVALILAAQCTDERVNRVTRTLFKKYKNADDFARAPQEILEAEIRPTGFYRNKAATIRACCRQLTDRFHGQVPDRMEDLATLQGVGRKTGNILLGNAFGIPAIGVDTHVRRLSRRMGFSHEENPDRIEEDLCGLVPREHWVRFCHLLQFHGRRLCKARRPACNSCSLNDICPKLGA